MVISDYEDEIKPGGSQRRGLENPQEVVDGGGRYLYHVLTGEVEKRHKSKLA